MDTTTHGATASHNTTMTNSNYQAPSKRASTRLSTFSITPTLAPSIAPSHISIGSEENNSPSEKNSSPMVRDMSAVHATLARLDEPRLMNQRYIVSENKKDEISKLALGAKLDRALGRRMSGQDASFTKGKAKAEPLAVKAGAA